MKNTGSGKYVAKYKKHFENFITLFNRLIDYLEQKLYVIGFIKYGEVKHGIAIA